MAGDTCSNGKYLAAGSSRNSEDSVIGDTTCRSSESGNCSSRSSKIPRQRNRHPSANNGSTAATLFVLLVLSLWSSSPSIGVEAFVGLAATTPTVRSNGLCSNHVASVRRNVRQHRPSGLPLASVPSAGAGAAASPAASSVSAAPDAGTDVADKVVAEAETESETASVAKGSKRQEDKQERIRVSTAGEMKRLLSAGKTLFELDARGDSQEMLEGREDEHPVLEALRKRAKAGTKPGSHGDGLKVSNLRKYVVHDYPQHSNWKMAAYIMSALLACLTCRSSHFLLRGCWCRDVL